MKVMFFCSFTFIAGGFVAMEIFPDAGGLATYSRKEFRMRYRPNFGLIPLGAIL
jgi:hypothetical protein